MIETKIKLLSLDSIIIPATRQRKELNPEKLSELAASIANQSLIHTILVDLTNNTLIAGYRRLAAFKENRRLRIPCDFPEYNSWNEIPVRFAVSPTPQELIALELEENIRRVNLTWEEEAAAVLRLHEFMEGQDPDWTIAKTAEKISASPRHASRNIIVAKELREENPKLRGAASLASASGIIERQRARAIDEELSEIDFSTPDSPFVEEVPKEETPTYSSEPSSPPPFTILQEDFHSWIESYSGKKFNLLHCDFPYGINHHKSGDEQGHPDDWGSYEDTPEVYFELLNTLVLNIDRILSPSAHIIFWFSMNYFEQTKNILSTVFNVDPFPLLWHKSDNKGILPDYRRGPRRIYETAFFCTRGERFTVKPVANTYSGPTKKSIHLSEKNESMLRHFLSMLVDEHTSILDPTCGSGSALRAAFELGAKRGLGLEKEEEFCTSAQRELTKAITLKEAQQ